MYTKCTHVALRHPGIFTEVRDARSVLALLKVHLMYTFYQYVYSSGVIFILIQFWTLLDI